MIHLRLIVPPDLTDRVFAQLESHPGVAHVAHVQAVNATPTGQVLLCDVVREAANDVIEWLQRQGVHRRGAVTVEALEAVISDAGARAEAAAPGQAADALIWEVLDYRARADSVLTVSFLTFMAVAGVIAAVGILLDAPILIVGAMVVGPEYAPLSALCVAVVRGRRSAASRAATTLGTGLLFAAAITLLATLVFRGTGLAPDQYDLTDRELTAFISRPDGMAAVVAVLAGIVGMLSLTEARSGALIGVLVSVTTIPAVAAIGATMAYGEWSEVFGAAAQLAINVTGLTVAGIATLAIQARATQSRA
jgi:uncharacterized hydrophobic protein (TIGR00271 family)